MKKHAMENEWERLIFESTKNKPHIQGVYPDAIVENRELLLLAQCEFGKIEVGIDTKFHTKIYKLIMKHYFQQKKCLEI
ncbi:MAG: hypothetical protein AABX33_09315 [Nanoarchaeota archaeon]